MTPTSGRSSFEGSLRRAARPVVRRLRRVGRRPPPGLADLLPPGQLGRARDPDLVERLRWCVHPDLYAAQLDAATLTALGAGDQGALGVDAALAHFLDQGARAGLRICALFQPECYAAELARRGIPEDVEPQGLVPFFHWLTVGWDQRIVPTPLFDEAFFAQHHPRVDHPWRFVHYLTIGCYETFWVPSPLGRHHPGGEDPTAAAEQRPLLLRELLHRCAAYDLRRTSWLEEGATKALAHARVLDRPRMRQLVDRAARIEPLVRSSEEVRRRISAPPDRHRRLYVADVIESMRRELPATHVDTLILRGGGPECDVAAAAFRGALARFEPDAAVLEVRTDPAGPWGDDVLDLTRFTAGLGPEFRLDVVLDLVRGLGVRRAVTVGSSLAWDLIEAFGRQLARQASLAAVVPGHGPGGRNDAVPEALDNRVSDLDWLLVPDPELRSEWAARWPPEEQHRIVLAELPRGGAEADAAYDKAVGTALELPRRRR